MGVKFESQFVHWTPAPRPYPFSANAATFKAFRGESARRRWALGGNRNPPGRRVLQENLGSLGRIFAYFLFVTTGGGAFVRNLQKFATLSGMFYSYRRAVFRKVKHLLASRVKFLIQTFFKKFGARPA